MDPQLISSEQIETVDIIFKVAIIVWACLITFLLVGIFKK